MTSVAEVASEAVRWTSDGATLPGFLAKPAASGAPAPAVVVLHEWWGLNDRTREVARRFAAEGFVALAPDLYARQGGQATTDPAQAARLMEGVSTQRALRDLNAGIQFLKAQPGMDPWKVGIVGFSMGGTIALIMAGHNSDLKACVAFYGKTPPVETAKYQVCPIQFHHAGKDTWVTRREVDVLREGADKAGKTVEVHVYPDAAHGFCNETQADAYRADDARLAWERALAFLRAHAG
jgi:carboxymethylenebutenolidase